MPFVTKNDLSIPVKERLEAINAQSAGERSSVDAAFLAARLPYLTNQILLRDENELIAIAAGNTVPTGVDGFAVGALFMDLDSAEIYVNIGTSSSASWDARETTGSGTPVNSAAASGVITATTNGNPSDAETITVGTVEYTFKTALSTGPTVANEILIGTDGEDTLTNLAAAINGAAGEGTLYSTGTEAQTLLTAGTPAVNTDATLTLTADTQGADGNDIVLTESATNITVSGSGTLAGGVDGTVGSVGKMLFDATYLYLAIQNNTAVDAVWRKIAHSAL